MSYTLYKRCRVAEMIIAEEVSSSIITPNIFDASSYVNDTNIT